MFDFTMMSQDANSISMLYVILVLVLSITQGASYPNINQIQEGKFGDDLYKGIDPRNRQNRNRHEQTAFTPAPNGFTTYVPLIDGNPIFIPDMRTDLRFREGLSNLPKASWRRSDETFSNRRSPNRRQHRLKTTEEGDFPTRPFGNRRRKHTRSQVDFEIPVTDPFTKEHDEDPESFTKKKPPTHVKPIHIKPEKPEIVIPEYKEYPDIIVEDEYEHPVVVEALTKKEKPATHKKKQSIHVKTEEPEEIVDPEYKEYRPEIIVENEYDHPVVVEALTKKDNPKSHKKPSVKPNKPEKIYPDYKDYSREIVIEPEYDYPVIVEALTKKEKPVTKKKPSIHIKPEEIVIPDYKGYHPEIVIEDAYDYPVVVEALTKKEKPPTHKKKQNIHVKPEEPEEIVISEYKDYPDIIVEDEYEHPVVVEALTKKEKPATHKKKQNIHVEPEEIVDPEYKKYRPEIIVENEYDHPVVVEALTKKDKPKSHKKPSVKPHKPNKPEKVDPEYKDYHHEIVIEPEYDHPVVVEALTKKEKRGTHKKPSMHIKPDKPVKMVYPEHNLEKREYQNENDENLETKIPRIQVSDDDTDNLDLARRFFNFNDFVDGSGSVPEEMTSRTFFPLDPNIWSLMSDVHAQERQKFKRCLSANREVGNCMPIQLCSVSSNLEDLLNNICTIDEVFIGVCCPEFPVETVRVDWDKFAEKQNGENVSDSEMAKECGKLPTSVNQTVAWPWLAPLVSTGKEFCGGALVTEQYVLSAAHCTTNIPLNRIHVRLGQFNREEPEDFEVVEIKRHAQYNSRTLQNDIALLKLSRKVQLGNFRRLICLPDDDKDYAGKTSILLGPNGFSQKTEQLESLLVISNQECQNKIGTPVGDSFLCTMPRKEDAKCNDDSGAPLVVGQDDQFKIVGILTWSRNDCDGRFPSKFTRVSKYKKWIENHAV